MSIGMHNLQPLYLRVTSQKLMYSFCSGRRQLTRMLSNLPEATVYTGPQPQDATKRVTLRTIRQKYAKGEPLSMVTAYDYPSAVHVRPLTPTIVSALCLSLRSHDCGSTWSAHPLLHEGYI